ncbi:helix-turn-helix domain-containing protein [Psychrobacillus sp. FSL H8-0483]|uniref:TetR/AcrR family transcriptional regulator n=1 Tax=Psychrobacillus sp. FSL H8-0483 TaxID=2921389 RepID=UPI00315A1304
MPDKKILIIEKAVELIAKNGFETTSVQEITEACGISKGAFYIYFKSKESLLISIFELFSERLSERISTVFEMNIPAKEKLQMFLCIQLEEIDKYSDFILMQLRENTKPDNRELFSVMTQMDMKLNEHLQNLLVGSYGDKVSLHLKDLILLVKGITKSYVELIVLCKTNFNYRDLAKFLVDRVDSLVAGLTTPFLTEDTKKLLDR